MNHRKIMHPIQTLSDNVADALKRGNKIQAIKLLRLENGERLKEAKDAIHTAFEGWQTEATASSLKRCLELAAR